jgi:hypothetical protein
VFTRFLRKNLPEEKTAYFICTFAGEVGNAGACDLTRFRYAVRFLGAKGASRQVPGRLPYLHALAQWDPTETYLSPKTESLAARKRTNAITRPFEDS